MCVAADKEIGPDIYKSVAWNHGDFGGQSRARNL